MKTQMSVFVSIIAAAALLTGCVVTSVYPFYTQKDVGFEPALLGQWLKSFPQDENWKFEPKSTNAYTVTYGEGTNAIVSEGHFFKLKGESFLDLYTLPPDKMDAAPLMVPTHTLMRVVSLKPNLKLAPMDYEWLGKLLEKDPAALRHHLVRTSDKQDEELRIVLTADTAELQKFITKHLKTAAAWTNAMELKRAEATEK